MNIASFDIKRLRINKLNMLFWSSIGPVWVQNGFEEKLSFLPIALDSCLIKLALALFRVQIRGASGAANLGSGLPKLNNSVVSRR